MTVKKTAPDDVLPFEVDAAQVLGRLRGAFAEVIGAIPGGLSSAAELHRNIKVDKKLGWKAFKVATAVDPLDAGPHVPGPPNMRTFLKAVGRRGVAEGLVRAASDAANDFERLVAEHAGDRAAFDSMISALATAEDPGHMDLVHRRAAFRSNRHIWGVQAKTLFKHWVLQPSSDDPTKLDIASYGGYVNLRQLRQNAPLIISVALSMDDDGTVRRLSTEPLDPDGTTRRGIGLIREFCSRPLPEFRTVEVGGGGAYGELIASDVGKKGAVTCIEGHVARAAVPRYCDEDNRIGDFNAPVGTPCEVLVLAMLVREDTFGTITPVARAFSDHRKDTSYLTPVRERDRLPLQESVVYLGRGPSVLHTADLPRSAQMAQYVFDRLEWDAQRFDVYRCRIPYPVMPSTMTMTFELPEAPAT